MHIVRAEKEIPFLRLRGFNGRGIRGRAAVSCMTSHGGQPRLGKAQTAAENNPKNTVFYKTSTLNKSATLIYSI